MTHHQAPLVVYSPLDSPINSMHGHICKQDGLREYYGQKSLDRQWMQMRSILTIKQGDGSPFKWVLMNDSDSFCITPELPSFLYDDPDCFWSNEVDDFRKDMPEFGKDFHKPLPQLAYQPPYFCSISAIEKMVHVASQIKMCPVCPFIDFFMVQLVYAANLKHKRYPLCASCETVTDLGMRTMQDCVSKRGATFLHAIKTKESLDMCLSSYRQSRGR